jgi:anaerobic selenocysteine-containing dehydrogenase
MNLQVGMVCWNRRSFLKGLGVGALVTAGVSSYAPPAAPLLGGGADDKIGLHVECPRCSGPTYEV